MENRDDPQAKAIMRRMTEEMAPDFQITVECVVSAVSESEAKKFSRLFIKKWQKTLDALMSEN